MYYIGFMLLTVLQTEQRRSRFFFHSRTFSRFLFCFVFAISFRLHTFWEIKARCAQRKICSTRLPTYAYICYPGWRHFFVICSKKGIFKTNESHDALLFVLLRESIAPIYESDWNRLFFFYVSTFQRSISISYVFPLSILQQYAYVE